MASETPVSDHPATSQQQEEVKKDLESEVMDKAENVSVPTDKEPPCPAPPPAAAADPEKLKEDDKIVDKPIAPPAVAEEKKPEVADPPVIESTAEVQKETPKLAELMAEERIEDKPPAEEDKKIEDALVPMEKLEAKLEGKSEPESVGEVKGEEKHQELEETAPPKAAEPIEVKDVVVSVSEAECTPGEPPVAPSAEAKVPEVVKHVEKEPPVEKVEVEDIKSSKVDETCVAEGEGSHQIKAEEEKGVVEKAEEKAAKSEEVKEPTKEAIEVKEASKNKVEDEPKDVKPEEKSVAVTEELVQCNQKPDEGVKRFEPEEEKSSEPEVASRDIEPVADNGKKKGETEAAAKESEAAEETKLEEEKLGEPEKADIEQSESNKDSQETRKATTQDEPKGDPPTTKPPHKPSFVKMMKQSLVKAKKAIIGKSNQSAKAPIPESKEQGNK